MPMSEDSAAAKADNQAPAASDPAFCPYVGLAPFEDDHADYFFGRSRDAEKLADNVLHAPITVLFGPSGVGKTSLLNVGLPRALAKRAAERQRRIKEAVASPVRRDGAAVVVCRSWSRDPRLEVVSEIGKAAALPIINGPPDVHEVAKRAVHKLSSNGDEPLVKLRKPLVIILDQFEEYFAYRSGDRDRDFEEQLDAIVRDESLEAHLLIVIREDRYYLLDRLRLTIPDILENTLELGHLGDKGVREAITRPVDEFNARIRGGKNPVAITPGFVDRVLAELRQDAGAGRDSELAATERPVELPYLQLALEKIWQAAGGTKEIEVLDEGILDHRSVKQIIADHLEEVIGGLTPDQQALCARLFDRLVTPTGTKFAMAADDLVPFAGGADENQVGRVLTRLSEADARVLTPVGRAGREPAFEIFHDVLGPPILRWKERFEAAREAEARERAERERLAAEASAAAAREAEARRRTRLVKRFVVVLVVLVMILSVVIESLYWTAVRGLPLGVLTERWAYLLGKPLPLPELIEIPAGSFRMGSPKTEQGRDNNEGPQRQVTIEPFEMGKNEVTFLEWDACVADGDCNGYRPEDENWGRGRRPVINVSWEDAKAYVVWLSSKTGKTCRLPSEAEWEYAARAGTMTKFALPAPDGSDDIAGKGLANCKDCGSQWIEQTEPVESFPANAFGVRDMHGNVFEWIEDCWHNNYAGAPKDGREWLGGESGDCSFRTLRSGSWYFDQNHARSASRGYLKTNVRNYDLGFRVVCSSPP